MLLLQTLNGAGLFPNHVVYGDLTHLTIFNPGSFEQLLNLLGFGNIMCSETGPAPNSLSTSNRAPSANAASAGLCEPIKRFLAATLA